MPITLTTMPLTAEVAVLIAQLGLEPHPEGGFYRETYRTDAPAGERAACTAIYFLVPRGVTSNWHAVDADEIWHNYEGAPLELELWDPENGRRTRILGRDIRTGQEPQIVVPGGVWQRSRSLGDYTLAGCTVAPAFEFAHFDILEEGQEPEDVLPRT